MRIDPIVIVGAGGHGRVVLDAARAAASARPVQVADDNPALVGREQLGIRIELLTTLIQAGVPVEFHVAIGDNSTRLDVARRLAGLGWRATTVIHPDATVASSASIAPGAFVAAGAIVAPGASVGEHAIINHHAVVDHDVAVGAGAHVAPGAVLSGGARLGAGVLLGARAVVLPLKAVGDHAVVGAGAVVTRNVAPGQVVLGMPARPRSSL